MTGFYYHIHLHVTYDITARYNTEYATCNDIDNNAAFPSEHSRLAKSSNNHIFLHIFDMVAASGNIVFFTL